MMEVYNQTMDQLHHNTPFGDPCIQCFVVYLFLLVKLVGLYHLTNTMYKTEQTHVHVFYIQYSYRTNAKFYPKYKQRSLYCYTSEGILNLELVL